ncbi:MAG: hypothetical protein MUE53_03435 [Chitinophagales bacterium]|jgi:hypothetical protein|nr:hypothetical protein [Chitinophagales bacterium]
MKYLLIFNFLFYNYIVSIAQSDNPNQSKNKFQLERNETNCSLALKLIRNPYNIYTNQYIRDTFLIYIRQCEDIEPIYHDMKDIFLTTTSEKIRSALHSINGQIYYYSQKSNNSFIDYLIFEVENSYELIDVATQSLYAYSLNNKFTLTQQQKIFKALTERGDYYKETIPLLGKLDSITETTIPFLLNISNREPNSELNNNDYRINSSAWAAKLALARLNYLNYSKLCVDRLSQITEVNQNIHVGFRYLAYINSKESLELLYKHFQSELTIKDASKPKNLVFVRSYVIREMAKFIPEFNRMLQNVDLKGKDFYKPIDNWFIKRLNK